ncbi:response regulator transcription factor [Flectobacillus major]|uniref:response regulator transcription factor n=1 Tax=Flectobacillus major TaxID=103 RepID=UPI00040D199C|nr:response regulator transcription factor [Flectobacillus major]
MTPKILTCVLVDDEQSNLDILIHYINQIPYLELKATFINPLEALAYLLKSPTDLLITDINMPRLSGIDLYESLRFHEQTQVIFISAYVERIIEAIQFSAVDYLQKPVLPERFEQATRKALILVGMNNQSFENFPTEVLRTAVKNSSILSEAEMRVLVLVAEGSMTTEIAMKLFISPRTVESHRLSIRKKLQLPSKYTLIGIAQYLVRVLKY